MCPIRRQGVETGDHSVWGKDGVVLRVDVGGAWDVLALCLDNGCTLLAVGEVDIKQLWLKDVTIVLEAAGRRRYTEIIDKRKALRVKSMKTLVHALKGKHATKYETFTLEKLSQ